MYHDISTDAFYYTIIYNIIDTHCVLTRADLI